MNNQHATWLLRAATLGLCACVTAATAIAQTNQALLYTDSPDRVTFQTYADSPDWKFFRNPSFCYGSEENDRGVLLIGYDHQSNNAHVAFWNKNIAGYSNFDRTRFELVLINVIPGVGLGEPNRSWGSNEYFVLINKDGQRVFSTKLNGQRVLDSFSHFDQLVFFKMDGEIAQHFQLGRTVHAMDHLRTCRPAA